MSICSEITPFIVMLFFGQTSLAGLIEEHLVLGPIIDQLTNNERF